MKILIRRSFGWLVLVVIIDILLLMIDTTVNPYGFILQVLSITLTIIAAAFIFSREEALWRRREALKRDKETINPDIHTVTADELYRANIILQDSELTSDDEVLQWASMINALANKQYVTEVFMEENPNTTGNDKVDEILHKIKDNQTPVFMEPYDSKATPEEQEEYRHSIDETMHFNREFNDERWRKWLDKINKIIDE